MQDRIIFGLVLSCCPVAGEIDILGPHPPSGVGVVMLLDYYTDREHVKEGLALLDQIRNEDYYVKMAVAWAVSIYYIKLPDETMAYLKKNNLDDFTYNKALQKITESLKISKETKQMIRSMKRK